MNRDQPTLIIRANQQTAISGALIFTGIDVFMAYQFRKELIDWKHWDTSLPEKIFFVLLVVVTVMTWIALVQNSPRLKMDQVGIWRRRHVFSHTLKLLVTWDNISYYTTQLEPRHNLPTLDLVIRKKVPDEPVNVNITNSDISRENILLLLRIYSKQYGFNDFLEALDAPIAET
jgi:hypothetical protein